MYEIPNDEISFALYVLLYFQCIIYVTINEYAF